MDVSSVEIKSISQELGEKIGAEKVKDDEVILVSYGFDTSLAPFRKPSLVILPEALEDVREVLKAANQRRIPVTVLSRGVNVQGMTLPAEGGIILDFRNMNRILEINTVSGYAVFEPGITYDQLTSALSKKEFRCAVSTAPGASSPLGNTLLRPTCSLATRHIDSVVDLEVVLPDGTVVHTGSEAFAGAGPFLRYGPLPDLAGLFCCAYGTLGVITKVSFRIYPKNESRLLNLTAFYDYEPAVKFIKDVINNNMAEHCIAWSWPFVKALNRPSPPFKEPPTVPPDALSDPRVAPKGEPYVVVTTMMTGYEDMMAVIDTLYAKIAKKYGGKVIPIEEMREKYPITLDAWEKLYLDYHQPIGAINNMFGLGRYLAWIALAKPDDIVGVEKLVLTEMNKLGPKPICYYSMPFDFGRAMLIRVFIFVDPQEDELISNVMNTFKKMYDATLSRYGAIPFRYRPGLELTPKMPGYSDLLKRIKKSVDPNNILNPQLGLFKED